MSMTRHQLQQILDTWLDTANFEDYCPNGLQVEGRDKVQKIVTGVTACQALVDAASEAQADALLVHHGYFWKGEPASVVGMKKRRLQQLLQSDLSLFAYHLPLDAHPEFGNNVELARHLQLQAVRPVEAQSPRGILQMGEYASALSAAQFQARLEAVVERSLVAAVTHDTPIHKVAICTGGGQGFIEAAVDAGADAFVTGEISEPTVHVARERHIHFFAAGHHATERFGVRALGEKLAAQYNLNVEFIDIDSPA